MKFSYITGKSLYKIIIRLANGHWETHTILACRVYDDDDTKLYLKLENGKQLIISNWISYTVE